MGYLDNSSVTVDAILTLKGRELLAKGGNAFNILENLQSKLKQKDGEIVQLQVGFL